MLQLLCCRPWWKDWQCGTESTGRGIRSVDEEDVGSTEQIQHSEAVGLDEEELLNLITSRIISNLCKRSHTHFI
jgi:hypothetical protein